MKIPKVHSCLIIESIMQHYGQRKGCWMKFGVFIALMAAADAFHTPAPIVAPHSGMNCTYHSDLFGLFAGSGVESIGSSH